MSGCGCGGGGCGGASAQDGLQMAGGCGCGGGGCGCGGGGFVPHEETLQAIGPELIGALLKAHQFSFQTDDRGDIFGLWEDNQVIFSCVGEMNEILRIQVRAQQTFALSRLNELLAWCNEWNSMHLWPTAVARIEDDEVAVYGAVNTDLEMGVSADQLDQLLRCGLGSAMAMVESLEQLSETSETEPALETV